MASQNEQVASIFEEIADLLDIENANPFRIRAYRNAARNLRGMGRRLETYLAEGRDLTELPGIGDDLASKIHEIIDTGSCALLQKLRRKTPPGLTDLLHIPGLGPRRVQTIYQELDIHSPEQLLRAVLDHRVQSLPGFGAKTEDSMRRSLEAHIRYKPRTKLADAAVIAKPLLDVLAKAPDVEETLIAGSFRRRKETVGDLDVLVSAKDSQGVMESLVHYTDVSRVLSRGTTRATVLLKSGMQVDLRVVPAGSFGAASHYFTGSKAHNIALRKRAQQRGYKLNEYGLFKNSKQIAGKTETEVYKALGLPFIPPELREDHGEIEAAEEKRLPQLVELSDLCGDLHAHTTATDGHNSLREMARAAKQFGLRYLAITEHSKRLRVAHGLDVSALLRQIDEIELLNEELEGITLLKGIEVDILEDGSLDLPDTVLSKLDLVIGAVHSKFHLSRSKQTQRILKAMDHPHFTLLAHPTGRLLEHREPYDIDMSKVIRQAKQRGCYLELNAHPERLDLLDIHCQAAKEAGVLISINSDAHSVNEFSNLEYGIGQARRGWLEKEDVLNTRSLTELKKLLRRTM